LLIVPEKLEASSVSRRTVGGGGKKNGGPGDIYRRGGQYVTGAS